MRCNPCLSFCGWVFFFGEIASIRQSLTNAGPISPRADNTKEEVEKLKEQIVSELEKSDGATREELRSMKATVEGLHRVATFGGPEADQSELKYEVKKLRDELRSMEDTTKNKVDIALLKEDIEFALQESNTLSETQVAEAKQTLSSIKLSELEGKTNKELLVVKHSLETLKRDIKEKKLADKTSEDLVRLRQKASDLSTSIKDAKTNQDLRIVQKSLDRFKIGELSAMDDSELEKINKDLGVIKLQLTDIEELVQLRAELTELKQAIESEVKNPTKKRKGEDSALNSALKKLQSSKIQSKSKIELLALKTELESVQDKLKSTKTKDEVKARVVDLKARISKSESTKELVDIQKSLERLADSSIGKKSPDEISTLLAKMEEWEATVAAMEGQSKIRAELKELKQELESAIKDGRGNSDVTGMVSKLAEAESSAWTTAELAELKTDATRVNADLKEKENAVKDLETINRTIEELLETKEGKQRDDLVTLKTTVDAIDLNDIDTKDEKLWEAMKTEIATLKKELENVDIADKTKKDLSDLRGALEAAIQTSEEKTKQELTSLKSSVEAIDTTKLDSSKHKEWEALKEEVDSLKKELKLLECEGLLASLKEQLKKGRSKGLSRIEISRLKDRLATVDTNFSGKSAYELGEIKRQLDGIAADIPKEGGKGRGLFKRASAKKPKQKEEKTKQKKKPGFMARFGGKKNSQTTVGGPKANTAKAPVAKTPVVEDAPKVDEAPATAPPAEHMEEKKEDDSPASPASKPPLSPTKSTAPAPTTANSAMEDVPMVRTNSKPVETDGNEVEAVMVVEA
mmetsp:Transcript_19808/g.54581  ORF Transcript_19808/g.54581 Transcript_19808/m.54581 type:complete len:807 (-) Transcript_19808:97-2517(-)